MHLELDEKSYCLEAVQKSAYRFIDKLTILISVLDSKVHCEIEMNDGKEAKKLNEHNLSTMRYVESNLLKAKTKITEIKNYNSNLYFQGVEQDIDNALVDVRAEMYDLHANLDKK